MNTVTHFESVIPIDFVTTLRLRAESVLEGIYNDYFSHKSFPQFQSQHLGHTSLAMKIAAYRFATAEILMQLKELLRPHVERIYGATDLLIHPIFYLRFSFPGVYYSEKQNAAFLDSQPHYDSSYGIEAFTIWMGLDDVDGETGGLRWFSTPEILDHFSMGSGNRYNHISYWEATPSIDPMLRRGTVSPAVSAGDVLTFDTSVLHGGTKPRTKRRVSFDFRLVEPANLNAAPVSVRRIFDDVNSALDLCNANNLILLGDFLGASRILRQVATETNNQDLIRVADGLAVREPDPALLLSGGEVGWRAEYGWLT